MNQAIATIAKSLINLLYPIHCEICKKSLDPLCDLHVCSFCLSLIKRNPRPYCKSCGRSLQEAKIICQDCQKVKFYFESARSACLYEGALKELIQRFKYNGKVSLAKVLSKLMIDFIKEDSEILDGADIITFVPLQNKRLRSRGFNQSKILALSLSKEFGIPILDILEKIRTTRPQNELARDDRLTNLEGAFKVRGGVAVAGYDLILVDDVMTTGASVSECSKVLLNSGAKRVRCFTLARGL